MRRDGGGARGRKERVAGRHGRRAGHFPDLFHSPILAMNASGPPLR